MFLDISVKDMIGSNAKKVSFNEVVITRRDVLDIPKLLQYLDEHRIHFDQELRLDSMILTQQNELGLIFFDHYGYLVLKEGKSYLSSSKFREMFQESEILLGYLTRASILDPVDVEDAISIEIISTEQMNELIINWFGSKYRNFRDITKYIEKSNILYDIDINHGYFSKVTNKTEFLETMFSRFIRIQKGSIPFSNDFGSSIKTSLHRKADYFTKKIILEEVNDFMGALSSIYYEDFSLVNIDYFEEVGIATKLTIYVTLQANKAEEIKFKLKG